MPSKKVPRPSEHLDYSINYLGISLYHYLLVRTSRQKSAGEAAPQSHRVYFGAHNLERSSATSGTLGAYPSQGLSTELLSPVCAQVPVQLSSKSPILCSLFWRSFENSDTQEVLVPRSSPRHKPLHLLEEKLVFGGPSYHLVLCINRVSQHHERLEQIHPNIAPSGILPASTVECGSMQSSSARARVWLRLRCCICMLITSMLSFLLAQHRHHTGNAPSAVQMGCSSLRNLMQLPEASIAVSPPERGMSSVAMFMLLGVCMRGKIPQAPRVDTLCSFEAAKLKGSG